MLADKAAAVVMSWLDEGVQPNDIAVLTRVNSALIPIKAALGERTIPTSDLLGPESLRRTMIQGLFAWMRLAGEPSAMRRPDVLEAVRRPSRGLNRAARELLPRCDSRRSHAADESSVQGRSARSGSTRLCTEVHRVPWLRRRGGTQ